MGDSPVLDSLAGLLDTGLDWLEEQLERRRLEKGVEIPPEHPLNLGRKNAAKSKAKKGPKSDHKQLKRSRPAQGGPRQEGKRGFIPIPVPHRGPRKHDM